MIFLIAVLITIPAFGTDRTLSGIRVVPFIQQVHRCLTAQDGLPSDHIRSVAAVDEVVCILTDRGAVELRDQVITPLTLRSGQSTAVSSGARTAVVLHRDGRLLTAPAAAAAEKVPAAAVCLAADGRILWAGTKTGLFRGEHGVWTAENIDSCQPTDRPAVRDVAVLNGMVAAATDRGLFERRDGSWKHLFPQDGRRRWDPADARAVAFDHQGRLWFAARQGVGVRGAEGSWTLWNGTDGLPYNDFTCMAVAADGAVWFGTTNGAVCFRNGVWEYRGSRRWLLDNHILDMAATPDGRVWLATRRGLSCIVPERMTLAEKAAFYEKEIDLYHRRTPYGYVVNAHLSVPGDKSTATQPPTDNDGQYTGLYAGAEALGFAATGDPARRERAWRGLEALAFLSEVTQGGTHPAPPGFIARAILSTDEPDPNERDNADRDRRVREQNDRLWKILSPRWPVSADGRWYWKADTSSDELDGHYFAYALVYDHVARTPREKAVVRNVVRRVTDHLIAHNYRLVDHDGTPTRWARFAPEDLNGDPDWWAERGLNSLSILTYLTIAHHITGDQKYRDHYERLAFDHHYAMNGMVMPKLQAGPGSFVQFDDEMAFMNYYHLIRYETDPVLLRMYYTSIRHYWNIEKYERNPFFNFVYAACCEGKVRKDQWGELDLTPDRFWLHQGVDTLVRYPLDLIDWRMDNRHRLDIIPLPDHVREPGRHVDKGGQRTGFVLPIDERQSLTWSDDMWSLVDGGRGTRLCDGYPFLLAYYMGLYHGYITESQ